MNVRDYYINIRIVERMYKGQSEKAIATNSNDVRYYQPRIKLEGNIVRKVFQWRNIGIMQNTYILALLRLPVECLNTEETVMLKDY